MRPHFSVDLALILLSGLIVSAERGSGHSRAAPCEAFRPSFLRLTGGFWKAVERRCSEGRYSQGVSIGVMAHIL
jgi:hypothetical protein